MAVRWLYIASHSFSPWQSGFSEMDAQGNSEKEPVNLTCSMKLEVKSLFFTRVQMAQSVDLAVKRWVGCLYEVMFSQTLLVEFPPKELRVKKLPAMMGLPWHPWCQRTRKVTEKDLGWEGVDDDNDSNESDADLPLRDEGTEAVSHADPLQLEDICDEAWHGNPLEASDDEASVDDAVDVAVDVMDGAKPAPAGDPTHMDVATPMPAEMALAPSEETVASQGLPSAVTVVLAEGTITRDRHSGDFVAKCTSRRHQGGFGVQKASDGQCYPGACKRTASGVADSMVAAITLVSKRPEHKAPTASRLTFEERIGATEFLKTIGGDAAHLLALERSKREDEGSEPEQQP